MNGALPSIPNLVSSAIRSTAGVHCCDQCRLPWRQNALPFILNFRAANALPVKGTSRVFCFSRHCPLAPLVVTGCGRDEVTKSLCPANHNEQNMGIGLAHDHNEPKAMRR